jgi:MgtC family
MSGLNCYPYSKEERRLEFQEKSGVALPVPKDSMPSSEWPYLLALLRLALGLFVGLEGQRRGKEAGLRTFAFASMLGCLGGLLGENFALLAIGLLGILIVLLTLHALRANHGTELTTSAALLVMGFAGVLCGQGHRLTPAAVAVLTAALLTWKEPLAGFTLGLSEAELRSAVLLAILAPQALSSAAAALALMLLGCLGLVALRGRPIGWPEGEPRGLQLQSPFSLVVRVEVRPTVLVSAGSGHSGPAVAGASRLLCCQPRGRFDLQC